MIKENQNSEKYFCTECGLEVKAKDKICPHCHADLSETVEFDKTEMVVLNTYNNEFAATMDMGKIKSQGIDSFISADNGGGMEPQLSYFRGIRLMVNEKDFGEALKVIDLNYDPDNYFVAKCKYCKADVTLNKKEYDTGEFICPGCLKRNKIK